MGQDYDATGIPEYPIADRGYYRVSFTGLEVITTDRENKAAPLIIRVGLQIEEPDEQQGIRFRKKFKLGTEKDPSGLEPHTRRTNRHWRDYQTMFQRCDLKPTGSWTEDEELLKTASCEVYVTSSEYNGKWYNFANGFYSNGRKDLGPIAAAANGLDDMGKWKEATVPTSTDTTDELE